MKAFNAGLLAIFLPALCVTATFAQTNAAPPADAAPPPSAPAQLSQADLEKLVAPIALYPDPLLATLLPASAYPVEIVEAARFVKDTNNIAKLDSQPWDDNVKAIARFPDVIAKMDTDIRWTSDLGQAFVENQKAVMEAVQALRAKAYQAGTLKTTPQQNVVTTNEVVQTNAQEQVVYVTNTVVEIQPSQPQVIYVPQYNPAYVYAPPPGYVYNPVAPLVNFGVGMAVGAVIANNCDWHSGGVYVGPRGGVAWGGGHYHGDVDVNRNVNVNNTVNRNANVNRGNGQRWQPDSNRRTSSSSAYTPQARGWGGQASQNASAARSQASQNASAARSQASQNASAARSQASQNASAARAQNAPTGRAQNAPAARSQASQNASAARAQGGSAGSSGATSGRAAGNSAFNSSGGASQARASSARGSASRGAYRGGGGGRRR